MTEIPGYRIRRELGHGGMATVYLAVQESLERSVALKVMAPALVSDRTFTQRFIKEGKTIAKFNHPNIVGIYDVGVTNQHHYIAMELIKGGDLKQRIKKHGPIEPTEALRILKDIAAALGYAHEQGFVHRDVKSENILFREDGSAVLTDFGIAKAADSGTRMTGTGMSIGTPHYMSPEQARGRPVDGRSDLYSLGIVFYEMLTGKVPFDAEDSVAIGIMHVSAPIPTLPATLSAYKPILSRLLAKDPKGRYETALELTQVVTDLGKAQGSKLEEGVVSSRVQRWGGRLGVRAALLTLLLTGNAYIWKVGPSLPFLQQDTTVASSVAVLETETGQMAPASNQGRAILQISSNPSGVAVYLDGEQLGITPFLSHKLPNGQHELSLRHKYFRPFSETVDLVDDKVVKRDITLFRGVGVITVLSEPSNAVVYLNGKQQSDRTPTTLTNVPAGLHALAVELERYFRQEVEIEVRPRETTRQMVVLEGGELVQAGDKWVKPEDAAGEFLKLARQAAQAGDIERTERYVSKARRFAEGGATLGALDGLLETARVQQRKARDIAKTARELAEAAIAKYDREEAIEQYQQALQTYPEDALAKAGLKRAQSMRFPGEVFQDPLRDGSRGPEMVVIPPGTFLMGSSEDEPGRKEDEGPQHKVTFGEPFAIGKYEVTFEEYDRFADATGRERPRDRGWGRVRRPVIYVSWTDAQAYVQWLSRLTGKQYRLPSEAEWEYAARSGSSSSYWWGSTVERKKANCEGCGSHWDEKKTLPVGSYNPNLFGLYDTSGNVFEWTEDCVNTSYENAPTDGSAWLEGVCSRRIYRGGSWYYGPRFARSANRAENIRSYRSGNVGFRVVRDIN